ncbi:mucin-3A-like [Schistocerca gregaria]|uniref:mucin-3A-like n=1 Tax=Schistocerca gregaria TaxID=7010 RepID=UPI00211E27A1|nr:mucin-3A-like [Schistocerca gregaria]
MGRHSLLLLTLGLSCYVHCLRNVSGRHHTGNLTTAEQLTQMAERFGATKFDELGTSDESSEAPLPSRKVKRLASAEDESDSDVYQGVMGRPGVDFPILPRIPRTTFNCRSVPGPGYYADMDTDCQVFHICDGGRKISFLCPNGTIFRQSHLICDWWWTVDCGSSREHYESSAETTSDERSRYVESDSSYSEQSPPASRNDRLQPQQAPRPQPAIPQRQPTRPRQRDSFENPQQNEQLYYSEQRRQNGQTQHRQQQHRGGSESVRNIAPSSPVPIVSEIRDADQRRRDQNSFSKQTEVEKQSKSYRSTTYTPPNALREGRNTYNNFALNTTSVSDRERQQPAETASFVNSRRNNGSRPYEVVQRNNVLSNVDVKDRPTPDQPGSSTGEGPRLQTSTATSVQRNAFAYSRKVQPSISERRDGRLQSVRWSNGEFQTIPTTVDLPPTRRQGQRSFEDGHTESGGISVTESSVRNSKLGTSKQYVELDRSKIFDSKHGNVPQSPTERTVTPIVVRIANPSTATWQFTTVAPEDLPITDIYRPTGTPFTLEDERGGRNFYTTPRTEIAEEDYVTINRRAGIARKTNLLVSGTVSVTKPAEINVAAADVTEPITDVPITDVNPPKELWFTHEDFAFMSTKASDDFDSTHITPQPGTVSTPTPTEASFDDEKLVERSETGHTAAVFVSSNNDQSVPTIINCSGLPHDEGTDPTGVTLSEGSGREINRSTAPQATGRYAFDDYSTSEHTTVGTELFEPKQTTERTFRTETISHMTASSSDLSLSITENKKFFYEKELTTDSSFDKEVSPSLWNERRALSSVAKTLDSSHAEEPPLSNQSLETDYISSEKSYSSDGKFSDSEDIESKTTSLPGAQRAVSRGILAPLPLSDVTGKEYQPQRYDVQYDVTTAPSNKEDIFDSSESSHARVTELFTLVRAATVSTAEENRETKYDVPVTPAYEADATESPTLRPPDTYDTDAATENASRADTPLLTATNPPAMQSVLPVEPLINSEVLGASAAATSRYESRDAKEISHPSTAKDAPQETTDKSTNSSTAAESVASFRRKIYHSKSSSADSVSTTSAPSTSPRSNRLVSSRKSVIFVDGPRRRLTTTTTTPSVIQRVLSLRQKTTPLTIPLRSAAATKSVTSKTTQTSEHLSKSLLPPKVQGRSEVKSHRRGSQLVTSRTAVESRFNKSRLNIPPSNRPDTLNSLAVYFGLPETEMEESDVSNRITKMMNDLVSESVNKVNTSTKEIPAQLPPLLTQLTRDSYSALFSLTRKMADMDEVLGYDGNNNNVNYTEYFREGKAFHLNETQPGIESLLAKNLSVSLEPGNGLAKEDVRGLRELAQIFSRALTAYLKDPTDFRRILSEARPTEPANNSFEAEMTTPLYETTIISLIDSLKPAAKDDDEVLDFSDVNKAPTLRLLSSTVAPLFDSLAHAATTSKQRVAGSEDSNSATASSKSEYTATESVSSGTGQTTTVSSEVVHESLRDEETNYNFLTTRDPLVDQQATVVDSTNAIAYEVNNLFVTETSTSETVNDYTLSPGTQKYTGLAYGPTNYTPTARAPRNQTKSRFGGFQNNNVQFQKPNTSDELVYDLIVNEEIPPLSRVSPTYSLGGKEVTYILTNNENKDALPTTLTDLEALKTEGAFTLTTRASFDELSTLQDSVIPEEVNNLAVTTSNTVVRLKEENRLLPKAGAGFSTTVIDVNASGTPSTLEASNTVSVLPLEFSNKLAQKSISQSDHVNEFGNGDVLKSKHTQENTKGNGEESLIVSGTSGFGTSLKQQSTFQKTRAGKQNQLEINYNSSQTNDELHDLNQDKNRYPVHTDSSVLKPNEMTELLIDESSMTKVTAMNITHTASHERESMGKQSHTESAKAPNVVSDNKEELSSLRQLPDTEVTQQDTPSQETATLSWEDYDATVKQMDAMNLRGTNSSPTMQRMENEKILPLEDNNQKPVSQSPMTKTSPALIGGVVRNIQIDGPGRVSVNTFTSPAPQKMETITKRTQKSRSDKEMTTNSPKVTISSRGFSFATTVDETRDILERGRASLLQSSMSSSTRIDMSPGESGYLTTERKVQKLNSESRTKDRETVSSESQDNTHDSTLKMVKDNLSTNYFTVITDIKSATHPSPLTNPVDLSEWESTDSKSSGAIDTQNLEPVPQEKNFDDYSSVTMDPAALPLITTLEAPVSINQLHMKQNSVNNHLSQTGKQLNVLTDHIGEISSPLGHDGMTTELTPDSEVTTGILSIEHNTDHFMSNTQPVTILETNKDSSLMGQLNDKNDILPSTPITIASRKNRTITYMTHEEKETLNHLQEIFSLDTATVAKAGKLFMALNETSRHALMEMMKEAASNSSMRELVVVVVNKSLSSMDFSHVKKHSIKNQSNLPYDENMEPQMQQTSTEYTAQKNMENERKHLRSAKGSQSLTTTEPPVTTYHSKDRKYRRFKSVPMPTMSVLDLITSKNHTSFDEVPTSKPGVVDHSQLSASVSEPEENVSSEADTRVVELLRSLYSLAAKWG